MTTLEMHPAMCGATWPGAHQHHQLDRLVVVVPLGAAAGYYGKVDVSEAGKVLISTAWTRTWLIEMETVEM